MTALTPDRAWNEMTVAQRMVLLRNDVLERSSRRGNWGPLEPDDSSDETTGEVGVAAVPGIRGSVTEDQH